MAAYSLAAVAFALGTDRKKLENLLARTPSLRLPAGRQGKKRRLSLDQVSEVAAAFELQAALDIPLTVAAAIVGRLKLDAGGEGSGDGPMRIGPISVHLDFADWRRVIASKLADALEMAPRPARGRPPKR